MNEVILILPFFGDKFPSYFRYWLKSVEGRALDVMLVTDMRLDAYDIPKNVRVLDCSLLQLRQRAEAALKQNVALDNVRKLCDLKPFYGKIFEQEIKGYAYWAFGDADLVYGRDLDRVIHDVTIGQYDVWSNRKNWISGAFCIIKNTPRCRDLAMDAKNWKTVLANPEYLLFDELSCNEFDRIDRGEISIADCAARFDNFSGVVWRSKNLKFYHADIICEISLTDDMVIMDNGELSLQETSVNIRRTIPIFHYINAKKQRGFTIPEDIDPNSFVMTSTGMYPRTMPTYMRKMLSLKRSLRGNLEYAKYRIMRFVSHRIRTLLGRRDMP